MTTRLAGNKTVRNTVEQLSCDDNEVNDLGSPTTSDAIARAYPPAKLNLFLELLARRPDGFHEIDTVMVPIDLCDDLQVSAVERSGVSLTAKWLPSTDQFAAKLGLDPGSAAADEILDIPIDDRNLVCRALNLFLSHFGLSGGFDVILGKRIPAGAGMGGASSDAAAVILCAAELYGLRHRTADLHHIAAQIGSDVPFFLGPQVPSRGETDATIHGLEPPSNHGESYPAIQAGHATGRGEKIAPLEVLCPLYLVVVYPAHVLSTATVFAKSEIPDQPRSSVPMIDALRSGNLDKLSVELWNRLSIPAAEIVPRIDEILKTMWQTELSSCQLTGSGSACFGIAGSAEIANRVVGELTAQLIPANDLIHFASQPDCAEDDTIIDQPGSGGALILTTQTTSVPTKVFLSPDTTGHRETTG